MTSGAPTGPSSTFSARIRYLVGGRKVTPWAAELGISTGTRAEMLKGEGRPPSPDALARVMRVEGVSLSWLLGANVPPYLVNRPADDVETAARLRDLLTDEAGWRLVLLTDGDRGALLLHQPAEIELKNGPRSYTATEVIAGPIGERTLQVAGERLGKVMQVRTDTLQEIYAGRIGTYGLVGDERHRGLVDIASDYTLDSSTVQHLRVAESLPVSRDVPRPLAPLARWWPLLTDGERDAITTLLDPMLANAARRLQTQGG